MAAKRRSQGRPGKRHKAAVARERAPEHRPVGAAEVPRGFAAFERGNYDEAIRAWQAGQDAGAPPALRAALAEAYFRRALGSPKGPAPANTAVVQDGHPQPSRGLQDLQRAVTLAPQHGGYHFHLALAHHRAGDLRAALAAYEHAHRLAPRDARVRHHLTLALLCLEHAPASADRARELLASAPVPDEAARRLRALAYLRAGDPAAALAALDGKAKVRPSPSIALARGLVHLAAGQREAAQASLDTLIDSPVHRRRPGVAGGQSAPSSEIPASALASAAALATTSTRLGSGNLGGAFEALQRIETPVTLGLRPIFIATLHRLAVALALDERVADAASTLEQTLTAEPDRGETLGCLTHLHELAGVRAAQRGDVGAAAQHWEAALGHAGEAVRPRLLRNLALVDERLERWDQASVRWEELVRQWRKELQTARQRRASGGKGDAPAKSRQIPSLATALQPPEELRRWLAVAYRHQASALEAAGDHRGAIRTLERAFNFDPANLDLRWRIAELYLDHDQYGPAIEQLERLHGARPGDVNVLLELGSALDLNGDERQALRYLEQARALEPENEAVKDTLASVHHGHAARLAASGANERALAEYLQAVELAPHRESHQLGLGMQYLKMGQLEAAARAFERAVGLNPNDGFACVLIGISYLGHGHLKLAERFFRQALQLDRGLVMQAAVGLAYFRNGEISRAQPYLNRVLKSRDARALTTVGQALMDAGHMGEALPYLERAVEVSPLNAEAHMALAYARAFGQHDHIRAAAELEAAKSAAELVDDRVLLAEIAEARSVNATLGDLKSGVLP